MSSPTNVRKQVNSNSCYFNTLPGDATAAYVDAAAAYADAAAAYADSLAITRYLSSLT